MSEETLQRRFWISVRREKNTSNDEKLLLDLGFRPSRETNTMIFKTVCFDEMLAAVSIAEKLIKNSGHFIQLKTTTQPVCLACGRFLRFGERVCTCGSERIEPSGFFDMRTRTIMFKEEKE